MQDRILTNGDRFTLHGSHPGKINWAGVPPELKERRIWVGWRYEDGADGHKTKVPRSLRDTGSNASTSNPTTWVTSSEAIEQLELAPDAYDGLGVVLKDDLCGVEIDACRDPKSGVLADWAQDVVNALDSFTEVSPSGTGVHIYMWADISTVKKEMGLPEDMKMPCKFYIEGAPQINGKTAAIEIYDKSSSRYFTITGEVLGGRRFIEHRQNQFSKFYQEYFNDKMEEAHENHVRLIQARATHATMNPDQLIIDDEAVLKFAFGCKNGDDLRTHYEGHWEQLDKSFKSQSEADNSLVARLAFYTGPDSELQLKRLFMSSGMYRSTGKHKGYLDTTIRSGLDFAIGNGKFYNWDRHAAYERSEQEYQWLIEMYEAIGKIKVVEVPEDAGEPDYDVVRDALVEGGEEVQVILPNPNIDLDRYHNDPTFGYLWRDNHAMLNDRDRARRIDSVTKIFEMIPETGFLRHYIKTYLPISDLPVIFHLAAALSTSAHFLNRKIGFMSGTKIYYPNLWIALIAQSTVIRKSTAIDVPYDLITDDEQYCKTVLSDEWTKPQLVARFGKYMERMVSGKKEEHETVEDFQSRCLKERRTLKEAIDQQMATGHEELHGIKMCHMHEVGGFLVTMNSKYNEGVKEFFTKIYDVPSVFDIDTKTSGYTFIVRPFPNFLGATTMEWLTSKITHEDIASGFMPRWLLVPSWIEERDFKLPIQDEPDYDNVSHLKDQIDHLKKCHGLMKLTADAKRYYWDWNKNLESKIPPHLLSWAGRMDVYAYKFAMVYECICGFPDRTEMQEITLRGIEFGTALVEYFLTRLDRLTPEFAFGEEQREINRVHKIIRESGRKGITYSQLLRHYGKGTDKLRGINKTLATANKVVSIFQKKGRHTTEYLWAIEHASPEILRLVEG